MESGWDLLFPPLFPQVRYEFSGGTLLLRCHHRGPLGDVRDFLHHRRAGISRQILSLPLGPGSGGLPVHVARHSNRHLVSKVRLFTGRSSAEVGRVYKRYLTGKGEGFGPTVK